MPLYMDIHEFGDSISAEAVAQAHQRDLHAQARHKVSYRGCWVDETAGRMFCLIDAPDEAAAAAVHRDSHGLVAHEIYQVVDGR